VDHLSLRSLTIPSYQPLNRIADLKIFRYNDLMIRTILSDLSYVLLFPKNSTYKGTLNGLYDRIVTDPAGYNFNDYFTFNQDLFNVYKQYGEQAEFDIFTSGHMQDDPAIKETLFSLANEVFSAEELNLPKGEVNSYKTLADILGLPINEILYVDDDPINITAAKDAGMQTIWFLTNQETIQKLQAVMTLNSTPESNI